MPGTLTIYVLFLSLEKKEEIVLKKIYNATEAMGGKGQKAKSLRT